MRFVFKKILFVLIFLISVFPSFSKTIKVGIFLRQKRVFVSSKSTILVYKGERRIAYIPPNAKYFFWVKHGRTVKNNNGGWYIQVGVFKRDKSIQNCSRLLAKVTDLEPVIERTSKGLYVVKLGPFDSLSEASALKDSLKMNGFPDVFILSTTSKKSRTKIYLIDNEYNKKFISHSKVVLKSKSLIKVNGKRYRGIIEIVSYNGKMNVINVIDIEDYLKGVVPAEMSPKLYPDIEALKAQAVAARTYVYYNLGQFKEMGFDICATQSCQVYKGYDVENDLSSEAVDETAGEIIVYNNKPINAMFTAYCGGHTEDFENVFGGNPVPYLKGVKCEGEGSFPHKTISAKKVLEPVSTPYISRPYFAIAVLMSKGLLNENELNGLNDYSGKGFAQAYLNRILRYVGIDVKEIPLKSGKLSDIGEYLSIQIFNTESMKPLFESELITQDLPDIDAKKIDIIGIAYSLLKNFENIDYYDLDFLIVDKDFLMGLEDPEFLFINQGRTELSVPIATIRVGDRLRIIYDEKNIPLAITIVTPESQLGLTDSFLSGYVWYKFLTLEQLQERAGKFGFKKDITDIEIVKKTDTGRVVKIRVKSGNYSRIYSGLKVRWFFGVKENKFQLYKRFDDKGKLKGVYIVGNAWGHGVGMCQIGAFGLALKGWDYKKILKHYYTGVEIKEVE
ncbi:hypothetical protein TTHT_0100 [Thermotomaculum hydrothermale]|uniref:SPOR domain-containing protein n=1 Tax=Thermotomaculum hydrothermale TaxID=981385 RepID=A0A7R6PKC4_9BACT|nr:SpoIID/LytB domain-containing protein [Thermotomaculum hydrothermale]BBB31747.1 hypothetical protein TTHT_0100 [Thermotomaculum hydrothermale]